MTRCASLSFRKKNYHSLIKNLLKEIIMEATEEQNLRVSPDRSFEEREEV